MYSPLAPIVDTGGLDESQYLFDSSHDVLLSMPMAQDGVHIKTQPSPPAPIDGFNSLHYTEPSPSSVHYADAHEASEVNGNHISGTDGRDGSTSSGYINGAAIKHNSAAAYLPHPLRTSESIDISSINPQLYHDQTAGISLNGSASNGNAHITTPVPSRRHAPQNHQHSKGTPKASSTPEMSLTPDQNRSHKTRHLNSVKGKPIELKANSSIPAEMSWEEFGRQCILAAESSRLNPFALHPNEYKLLRHHVTHAQVTIYLNIRNAILRLWTRNPLVYVSLEEAAGCARDKRYFNMAKVAYYWLMRNGYINFGCVETPNSAITIPYTKVKRSARRTVIVVGAGMSGLGCARHLESLFAQLGNLWVDKGERPPRVIVLEGRRRIGGRVYSHRFHDQTGSTLPPGYLCTAEMGAQIVTGYEHGNPMNAIIRGQLAIPYHGLRDNTILYDYDGTVVERSQDMLVEKLYNDVLERASVYRNKPAIFRTVEGDRNLMVFGREPSDTAAATIAELEQSSTPLPANATTTASTVEEKPSTGVEKRAGRTYQLSAGFNADIPVTKSVQDMGWQLKDGAPDLSNLNLDSAAKASKYPTLGKIMDEGIRQYQKILDVKPRDLRLFNWHHANLEYANAVSVNQLSLSGWDQDIGNEFEGQHTEIIGGYQQVPRGLWQCPTKLDVRFNSVVKTVKYNTEEQEIGKAVKVECTNGEVFEGDEIVLSTPLGVLKSGSVDFQPPLPAWKQNVIERMGFGLLNKVILVYEEAFWEPHRDMFGLLNEAEHQASLNPEDYSSRRGRYYLFWNCIVTSGKPTLIALMAGEAAHYAEITSDYQLVKEVTDRLDKMFAPNHVPFPKETIVTRWSKDPFARGSYSYVGPRTQAGDYDVMAKPHGPVHFAGEATCGTHPATVHGAYLSGLRAAAEVVESMIGPIQVPSPLVEKKVKLEPAVTHSHFSTTPSTAAADAKRKLQPDNHTNNTPRAAAAATAERDREDRESAILAEIFKQLGERPIKPGRTGVNPFLLYTKDHWYAVKSDCDEKRRAATGDPNAKASKTEIRTAIGLKWRTEKAEVKQPYLDQTKSAKEDAKASAEGFRERVEEWDREAERIRGEFLRGVKGGDGVGVGEGDEEGSSAGGKRVKRV
ncbi:hypothetical protein DM02DRAFT_596399 [Periconia macrospinosa]|uniref:SWIRM domain-containing protein n=1 Tax=Periconia macrospinosa TaxID=97972 RepID=A0A2V1DKP1_9PLEO|nr:hypothetical protein DM02DRAFT_596399 [Periconia macrospinosa]